MNRKFRIAGWLAVSALLAAAVLAPASVFATDLHASHQGTSWNDPELPEQRLRRTQARARSGRLALRPDEPRGRLGPPHGHVPEGRRITVANTDQPVGGAPLRIVTGHDTLLDAETTDVDGRNLNLSHICACGDKASQSAPAETASAPVETETAPAETQPAETQPVETQPAETRAGRDRAGRTAPAETQPAETARRSRPRPPRSRRPRFPPRPRPSRRRARARRRAWSSTRSARTVRRTRARAARSTRRPARRTRESRLRRRTPSRTRPTRRTAAGS